MPNLLVLTGISLETSTIANQPGVTVLQGDNGRAQLINRQIDPKTVDAAISWGTCGALKPGILVGTLCVSTAILDHSRPAPYPTTTLPAWRNKIARIVASTGATVIGGTVYSGPKEQTDTIEQKAAIFKATGCVSADEGSYALADWAIANQKRYCVIGGVSDSADMNAVWPPMSMNADGSLNIQATLQWLASKSQQVQEEVFQEGLTTGYCLQALRIAAQVLANNNWGL